MNKKGMLFASFVVMAVPLGPVVGCAVDLTTPLAETPAVDEPHETLDMASSGGVGWIDDAGQAHDSTPWVIYFGATAAPANGVQSQP